MKIALVGYKGKTSLARKMAKEDNLVLIDNIPQKFSKVTGLVVGTEASPQVNTILASLRVMEEYKFRNENFVSTTTVVDSLVYVAHAVVQLMEQDVEMLYPEYEFTSAYLAGWLLEKWNFDRIIYIPYKGKDELGKSLDGLYKRTLEISGYEFETVN